MSKGSVALLEKSEGGKVDRVGDSVEGRTSAKDGSTLVSYFSSCEPFLDWSKDKTATKQVSIDS